MNNKIVIAVAVVITIVIASLALTFNDKNNQDLQVSNSNTEKIDVSEALQSGNVTQVEKLLTKIKEDKIKNDNSENPYYPPPREWISTGPVKIDYSEYYLGQKIFVNIEQVGMNEKGEVIFFRPINNTHNQLYFSMPFDGSGNRNNFYITPELSEIKEICNKEQLIGKWKILVEGTNYPVLEFEVINSIIPGTELRYEPITQGLCQN